MQPTTCEFSDSVATDQASADHAADERLPRLRSRARRLPLLAESVPWTPARTSRRLRIGAAEWYPAGRVQRRLLCDEAVSYPLRMSAQVLPDLSTLSHVNLQQRLLNMMVGKGAYPDPLSFQVTTAARLLDKTLEAWRSAGEKLAEHVSGGPPSASTVTDGKPISTTGGWTTRVSQELFSATDRLEDVVDSLARLLRLVDAVQANPSLQGVSSPALSPTTCDDVRVFRNRIAHGDEDFVNGKAGRALITATLRADTTGIEIRHFRLEYDELEAILTSIHDYLQRVIV